MIQPRQFAKCKQQLAHLSRPRSLYMHIAGRAWSPTIFYLGLARQKPAYWLTHVLIWPESIHLTERESAAPGSRTAGGRQRL